MGMFYHVAINTLVRILTTKKMDVKLITVPEMLKLTGVKRIGLMKVRVFLVHGIVMCAIAIPTFEC